METDVQECENGRGETLDNVKERESMEFLAIIEVRSDALLGRSADS